MPRLILLCGVSGSGKSTYAASFLEKAENPPVLLSSDALLDEWAQDAGLSYQEAYAAWATKAQEEVLSRAAYAVHNKADVLWDQTNLTWAQRAERLAMFEGYDTIAVAFEAPRDVLDTRVAARASATGKAMPEAVLTAMDAAYERPHYDEGFDHIVIITPDGAQTVL